MTRPSHKTYSARDAATKIVAVLQNAGYTAYFAGGCVRDRLLGVDPLDFDVATDARPDTVCELFRNTQYVGEAFGVVLVRLMGHSVEVATFRLEWGYEDGRHPTAVDFTDAQHDARRRDFTINGLFENPLAADHDDQIIDYVNGQADLAGEIIRAIGDADERFAEDYLRMLRAVRFAARLDFEIELGTFGAICREAENLDKISRERIGGEVRMMLTGRGCATAVKLMQQLLLDGPVLGEEPFDRAVTTVERLEFSLLQMVEQPHFNEARGPAFAMVLLGWLFDRHVRPTLGRNAALSEIVVAISTFTAEALPGTVKRLRKKLCLTNDEQADLGSLGRLLIDTLGWQDMGVAGRKRLLANPLWQQVWALVNGLGDYDAAKELVGVIGGELQGLFAEGVSPPPLVTGDDLIGMGLTPGPDFKRILDAVYDAQLEGRVGDKDAALGLVRGL